MPPFRHVAVYWLELPGGRMPAKKEYEKYIEDAKAQAAFGAMDQVARSTGRIPRNLMQKIGTVMGRPVQEVKAPHRGRVIGRLLCLQWEEFEFYVAVCLRKKAQKLDKKSIKLAERRIRDSLEAGGP